MSSFPLCASLLSENDEITERLRQRFSNLDKSSKGFLSRQELERLPELAANPLANRIISVFLSESVVDFQAFCRFMSIFTKSASRESKLKLAFSIYDVDNDGIYYILFI